VATRQLMLGAFDPDTIAILLRVLDDVSAALKADESTRQQLAREILVAAKDGERDPVQLRERVLGDAYA
jgi:hypothetical protein